MSDRELLELAAKAVGVRNIDHYVPHPGWAPRSWNPLTSDGDALRLAVKLRMSIEFTRALGSGHMNEFMQVCPSGLGHLAEHGPIGSDATETIRRAIVRAAAEIGRTM